MACIPKRKKGNQTLRDSYLKKALAASTDFALPFRNETFDVMNWAGTETSNWKINYYKALFLWHKGRIEEAAELFNLCGDEPANSSFYITRASFRREHKGDALSDYKRAITLDKNNWRAHHYQINYLNSVPDYKKALVRASIARLLFKSSYILHFDYAKTLMLNDQYQKCLNELEKINLLPNEGAREGHDVYRASYLMLAIEALAKSKYKDALKLIEKAKEWPENLGAGKPYDFDLRIEYYLESICHNKMNDKDKEKNCYAKIEELETKYSNSYNANIYISALVKKIRGDEQTALELLKEWNEKSKNIFSDWAVNQFIARSFIPIDIKSWFVFENDYNSKLVYEIAKQIK